jgi:signal transduction histidine kinase
LLLGWLWVCGKASAQAERTAELKARVADRTRELQAANGRAKSGARVKTEFLATRSHELRMPMDGVLGSAELLAGTRLDENQTELLSPLRSSAECLLYVVNDSFDLSKIDAGHLHTERIPVCLSELLIEVCNLARPVANRKQLTLALKTEGAALGWIESDPARCCFRCRIAAWRFRGGWSMRWGNDRLHEQRE